MDLWALAKATAVTAALCLPLVLSMWALLDCAGRPAWTWALVDRGQANWMAAILCGILVVPVGITVSIWYLARVRPQIIDAEQGKLPAHFSNTA